MEALKNVVAGLERSRWSALGRRLGVDKSAHALNDLKTRRDAAHALLELATLKARQAVTKTAP
ncbi:MAG: hypothetical protein ACFB2Z_08210 [Maricaulaceae bacterium]